jgi:hypothetical protein
LFHTEAAHTIMSCTLDDAYRTCTWDGAYTRRVRCVACAFHACVARVSDNKAYIQSTGARQVSFHTAFVEASQAIMFLGEDIDQLQVPLLLEKGGVGWGGGMGEGALCRMEVMGTGNGGGGGGLEAEVDCDMVSISSKK